MKAALGLLCTGLLVTTAFAEDHGKLLISEDFSQPVPSIQAGRAYTAKKGWRVLSGQWDFAGGALRGKELPEDGRSGFVVGYRVFKDAVIQFDVKMDGCRQVIFRIQDAVPEHICSVTLRSDGFTAQKDDHDHKGPDKAVPFGKAAAPIKAGEWKTVQVTLHGDRMTAAMDGHTLSGSDPLLAMEKATIEFVVTGESASFRNVRMWEGQ